MARVLLVKPRHTGPEFQSISHPLGLMYIAAALQKAGHEVRLHDCASSPERHGKLRGLMDGWRPDCIGVSLIVSELDAARDVMAAVRQSLPGVPVVFGGPWPSANQERALLEFGADYVIAGEGELAFPSLLNAIAAGRSRDWMVENIPGTSLLLDGRPAGSAAEPLSEEQLDALPFPAWELLDRQIYATTPSMAGTGCGPYMTIITSRGCPYACAYCHQTLGKRFRRRSAGSVLAELERLHFELGYSEFEIIDDCFNLDRDRMSQILWGIVRRLPGVKLHFPNGLRSDRLEPADLALMRRAGTVSACFAIETASPGLQNLIGKNLDIEKARAAIDAAVAEGIFSTGFFMLGLPTETLQQAELTVDFASRSPLHRAIFMLTTPFAGTRLAEMAATVMRERGIDPETGNLNYFTHSVNISGMTDNELHRIFRGSYRRFYLNPRRIARIIARHPRKWSLPRYGLMTLIKIMPGIRRVT